MKNGLIKFNLDENKTTQVGMVCQCWCYHCTGKLVTRTTFRNHGRKDKPDEPLPKRARILPMDSMPDNLMQIENLPPDNLYSEDDLDVSILEGLTDEDGTEIGYAGLTALELRLVLLDWMCSHKVRSLLRKKLMNS